jgi:3-(3-hydroxy-phenyl)propionate hydroxylase
VLTVETPDGSFAMEADWVIACDGANSDVRRMVGAEFTGQFFQDRFLIADVVMKADFPTERWFWFDPPFHRGQSACCCTSSATTSGASTSSSAGTPTPRRRRSPRR